MTFLSLNIEKSFLTTQKSQLEFEEMCLMNKYNSVTEELSDYLEDDDNSSDDDEAKYLQNLQEYYDTQKGSIESQLKELNTEIESYTKAVETNIKDECKWGN